MKKLLVLVLFLLLSSTAYYCWISLPVATGYGAKVLASAVFISGRNEQQVIENDLNFFPVALADYDVNRRDHSVTASVFGLARQKAIWRPDAGATLVNDYDEEVIRARHFPRIGRSIDPDTVPWPMGNKNATSLPAGVDSLILQRAADAVFDRHDTTFVNETRALLVVYKGKIIIERYAPGFTQNMPLAGWSMTKSITGALAGILVRQGRLQIDSPAPVAEWKSPGDKRQSITIKHLLQQTSGLEFDEVYHRISDANRMLFLEGNAAAYAASSKLFHAPGQVFSYSSGNSNILSSIYRDVIGPDYHKFPYQELFHRVGMNRTILEPDASGTFVGSSFCYATARDWARFGLLYLNDGIFNNTRILPEGWVKQSTTPAPAATRGEYGFQWWLNSGATNDTANRIYPMLPRDMYFADGYEGQNIFIIPSRGLVVVRLGITRNKQWGEEKFIRMVLNAFP